MGFILGGSTKEGRLINNEIEHGIAECEAKLPRNRTCEYVIIYDEVVG